MLVKEVESKGLITKSNLPDADYVINPYIGCPHKCIYCYAEFMKRFTNHKEEWGEFIDVKICNKRIPIKNLKDKVVLISSVTDPYNYYEALYKKTQEILKQLKDSDANIEILTKSSLVLRDLDLFKKFKNIKIGISINTTDDNFRRDIEPRAGKIESRIESLKKLKEEGISTYAFIGPIFPGITNINDILKVLDDKVDLYYFENLNLRGGYKKRVLDYIKENHPQYRELYNEIYNRNNNFYWEEVIKEIKNHFKEKDIEYKIYFYHDEMKKK